MTIFLIPLGIIAYTAIGGVHLALVRHLPRNSSLREFFDDDIGPMIIWFWPIVSAGLLLWVWWCGTVALIRAVERWSRARRLPKATARIKETP